MKVFVVLGGWEYEGFDDKVKIFYSREKAEEYAAKLEAEQDAYDYAVVVEQEVE